MQTRQNTQIIHFKNMWPSLCATETIHAIVMTCHYSTTGIRQTIINIYSVIIAIVPYTVHCHYPGT